MTHPVYKTIDLVGTSGLSIEDAIRRAVGRASDTLRNIGWFEMREVRGQVEDGEVTEFQVALRVSFRLEDPDEDDDDDEDEDEEEDDDESEDDDGDEDDEEDEDDGDRLPQAPPGAA